MSKECPRNFEVTKETQPSGTTELDYDVDTGIVQLSPRCYSTKNHGVAERVQKIVLPETCCFSEHADLAVTILDRDACIALTVLYSPECSMLSLTTQVLRGISIMAKHSALRGRDGSRGLIQVPRKREQNKSTSVYLEYSIDTFESGHTLEQSLQCYTNLVTGCDVQCFSSFLPLAVFRMS